MFFDFGDIISKEDFINMMGPQWEFQYANTTVNLEVIDVVHRFLDLGGMIPVFGTLFDGTNAILYFVEGDMVNWCLSMLGTIELIQYGCAGLKIAAKALKATDKMMLGKNSLKVATDSIGLIKAGKANMLDDIASITRTQKGYEFVTTDGIIFKMIDDDIPAAAKSVVKSMSDSTDELMTCLKREPEALFELVEETKELDNTILYRLRDDTEIQLFKSDLTPEHIICSTIGCFTGDTLVTTKEGLKRIDEVKTGDYVLSKDVKSGEIGYKKVNYVYIKNTNKLVQLIVGTEEINTTSSHLFFTDSGWWKSAKNIKVGDRILTDDGELKEVTATRVVELEEAIRIYNLNVDEFHTYFVGTSGLLVHNDCTAEMIGAGREAIANARLKGITDSNILSKLGTVAAENVPLARKSLSKASELSSMLGYGSKAIASDGTTNTLSGWAEITQGAEYFNRAATPQDVIAKSNEIGHTLKTDIFDNGIPGQYNASHAEKQLSLLSNKALGVSRPMCSDCVEYFKKLAKFSNTEKVVSDSNITRIFMPDGITIIEIPH